MGDTPDHVGHRARLRSRLLDDADGLADYELVEYLLALAIPRRDTKPLAKALLREFGSFSGVFNASQARLEKVEGLGATSVAHIKVIQAVAARFGSPVGYSAVPHPCHSDEGGISAFPNRCCC